METCTRWLCPMALLRLLGTLSFLSLVPVGAQHWNSPIAHAPHQQGQFPAQWPGYQVQSGAPVTMLQDRLMAQQLAPGQRRLYEISVPKGGSVGITVHPRRGRITWNITHDNVFVMMHPFFTHVLQAPLPVYSGPSSNRFKRSFPYLMDPHIGANSGRQKRQLYSGAVRSNFDFDVTELNAGYGRSLGVGSINYIKEDTGGVYTMEVANQGINQVASFLIYATLAPASSPYPRVPNDPQARVARVQSRSLNVEWQPVRSQYQPRTEYCVFHHPARSHDRADVHSSPYADHLQRSSTVRERCNRQPFARLSGLRPQTEYHIDVMARDLNTRRMTTFIGVKAATLSPQQQQQQVVYEQQHGPQPFDPPANTNQVHSINMVDAHPNHIFPAQGPGHDLVNPDLLQPNLDLLPAGPHPGEEVLSGHGIEEHLLPHDENGSHNSGSGAESRCHVTTSSVLLAVLLSAMRLVW